MNSCILMADIVQAPQLRYTSDSQTPVTEFIVQFQGLRSEDAPSQLKVVGWGNLAQEIQETYKEGDRVLLEGRLGMNVVERPEGFREKQAEMTLQRIHSLGTLASLNMPQGTPLNTVSTGPAKYSQPSQPSASSPSGSFGTDSVSTPEPEPDYDDIPF